MIRRFTTHKLAYLLVAVCLFVSCSEKDAMKENWKAEHVILIGLDGWGGQSMPKADMPNVKTLMKNGSYTFETRSVLPSSSAVNWASMFMGAGPELHGFTTWGSQKPDLPSRNLSHYGLFPTIFGVVRDAYPDAEIGYIFEWDGMQYLAEQNAMNLFKHTPITPENPKGCTNTAVEYIKAEKPDLLAVIYDQPDGVGHGIGFFSPEYYTKLKELDSYVGEIVQATKDAGIYEKTIFIVTADHGGIDKGHGGKTMSEMQTPFIICGPGVKQDYKIENSMMIFDIAATMADIFAAEQPQVWIGRPVESAFEN